MKNYAKAKKVLENDLVELTPENSENQMDKMENESI